MLMHEWGFLLFVIGLSLSIMSLMVAILLFLHQLTSLCVTLRQWLEADFEDEEGKTPHGRFDR